MADIATISTGAAAQGPAQKVAVPDEPRLPLGRLMTSVQPHPTPLISQTEQASPVVDEQARLQRIAQARLEITGTGGIVDTIA